MIGTETEADIRHVLFNNCVIRNSNKGFGINVQDGAVVSDVIVSNLTIETGRRHWNWWGSAEMCRLVLKKRTSASRLGVIRDVVIDNVIAHPRGTSTIIGHPDQPIENIRLSNVEIAMLPENAPDKRAGHALYLEQVRGAQIRNLSVRWSEEPVEPKWQSALMLRRVSEFEIENFTGRQGLLAGNFAAIVLDEAGHGMIRNARATIGCRRLIHVQGPDTTDITVTGSRMPTTGKGPAVTFETDDLRRNVRVRDAEG